MKLITADEIEAYLKDDRIKQQLNLLVQEGDANLTCQRWLVESEPKRYIFNELYGDLLFSGPRRRILDVGGGLTSFTRKLAKDHEYTLVDLFAHDDQRAVKTMQEEVGREFISVSDWYEHSFVGPFDIIIANDLFPNVDQRLQLFLDRALDAADKVRLSLTFYNEPRFYITRRCDADEFLCMLAWTGGMTRHALESYRNRIINPRLGVLTSDNPSVYLNQRQVCILELHDKHALAGC